MILRTYFDNVMTWNNIKEVIVNLNLSFCPDEAVVQGIETNIPGFPSSNTAMLIRGGINHFVDDIQLDLGLTHISSLQHSLHISDIWIAFCCKILPQIKQQPKNDKNCNMLGEWRQKLLFLPKLPLFVS